VNREPLQFGDLVRRELIMTDVDYGSSEEALRSMAGILVERGFCEPSFIPAILERERDHPSALPMARHKIAIPHTDATHVNRSALLFARLKRPVEFRSMGDPETKLQVSMISMFALREKYAIGDLLATLITVYQNDSVLNAIYTARDRSTIYELLSHHVTDVRTSA
jgi:galactitol PTS system EIIA component